MDPRKRFGVQVSVSEFSVEGLGAGKSLPHMRYHKPGFGNASGGALLYQSLFE